MMTIMQLYNNVKRQYLPLETVTTDEDSNDDETDLGELDLFFSLRQCDCYCVIVIGPTVTTNLVNRPSRQTL